MGTRNLTLVSLDGKFKVAQYGQWDGYPDGQGKTAAEFIRKHLKTKKDNELFKEKVRAVVSLTDEQVQELWAEVGADNSGLVNMEVSDTFNKVHPHLHRNCGADVLNQIWEKPEGLGLVLNPGFAADSLFCEWAYVIDLDRNHGDPKTWSRQYSFEMYKGFNKEPLVETDRFYYLDKAKAEYHPVKLVKSWSLEKFPKAEDWLKEAKEAAKEKEEA